MMMVLAALVVLSVVAGVRPAEQATCSETILCPCGDTDKYVKVCTEEQNPCIKWSNCKTCQDDFDGCLECPEGYEGLWCSKSLAKLSRQKRQTYGFNTFFEGPSQTTRHFHARGGCPELRIPKHGSIRCTYTNRQSTCVGNCLPGHRFENHGSESEITLTCTGRYYTPMREFPPCISEGYCDLIIQGPGTFNCTTSMRGTLCDVVCYGRFMGRYFCLPEQPWEPALPSCVQPKAVITRRVTCPDPGFIKNGHRSSYNQVESVPRPSFEVDDRVGYTCIDRSFELQGRHVLRCMSDGKWNHPVPNCVKKAVTTSTTTTTTRPKRVTCPDPGFIENGRRSSYNQVELIPRPSFELGAKVGYTCVDRSSFELQGKHVLTCGSDGKWNHPKPTCVWKAVTTSTTTTTVRPPVILCPDPGVDSNSLRHSVSFSNDTDFPPGSVLEYTCKNGYHLHGQDKIFCLITGRWSAGRPTCVFGAQQQGPQYLVSQCTDPGVDPNGRRSSPNNRSFPSDSVLEYSCNAGYELDGPEKIYCLGLGRWSSERPKCKVKVTYCRDPGIDLNGGRNLQSPPDPQGFLEGSRLEYFCTDGYDIDGERSILCLRSGRWSSERPKCKPKPRQPDKSCPNPPSLPNGRIVYYPPAVTNVRRRPQTVTERTNLEYTAGSLLFYSCNSGYTLQGIDSLACEENGEWSSGPPACISETICPKPPSFPDGRIVYYPPVAIGERRRPQTVAQDLEYHIGSLLLYSCNSGYELEGIDTLTCEENGEWSSRPPVCISDFNVDFCPDPGVDPNGYREPRRSPNREGFPHGQRVEYFCNLGYTLEGASTLICLSSGDWLTERPKCIPQNIEPVGAYCPNPGDVANGRVVYYTAIDSRRIPDDPLDETMYPEGSRLRYSCDPEYILEGEEFIICQSNGRWLPRPPICASISGRTIRYCDELGLIANGEVEYFLPLGQQTSSVIDGAGFPQYPVGTRLEYSCDIGYVLEGPSKLTCQESGDWSPEFPPNCITRSDQHILSCLTPGSFPNGNIRQLSRMVGPRIGSSNLVPEDTREFPEGTTLKYECDEGYTLEGIDTITCTSSGIWTYPAPKCQEECGFSSTGATRRILFGNKTMVGEWPWVVGIAVEQNDYIRIICGGALLNTRTVITAAHCLTGYDSFLLYFGKYYRSVSKDDKDVQVARSDKVIIHPNYNNVTMDSDIALIKFKPKIKYSLRVQPICLPTGTTTTVNLDVGRKGFVTGWGLNEDQVDSGELMMAYLPYQSNQNCLDSFRVNSPNFRLVLTQNMFCAGYPHANQSTCTGDSGSPMVFFDSATQRHTIEGLVSFTVEGQCGLSGIFSIYTKVYQYIPWILRNL